MAFLRELLRLIRRLWTPCMLVDVQQGPANKAHSLELIPPIASKLKLNILQVSAFARALSMARLGRCRALRRPDLRFTSEAALSLEAAGFQVSAEFLPPRRLPGGSPMHCARDIHWALAAPENHAHPGNS
eukprot:s1538_g3.t1